MKGVNGWEGFVVVVVVVSFLFVFLMRNLLVVVQGGEGAASVSRGGFAAPVSL